MLFWECGLIEKILKSSCEIYTVKIMLIYSYNIRCIENNNNKNTQNKKQNVP